MTGRYALRSRADGSLLLATKPRRRAVFAAGCLLLAGSFVAGFDPAVDLAGGRAPMTVFSALLLLACLAGALASRRAEIGRAARTIPVRLAVAGIVVHASEIAVAPDARIVVAQSGSGRASYSLELRDAGGLVVLDSSSWKSELEPRGRRIAEALGLPFAGPDDPAGRGDVAGP